MRRASIIATWIVLGSSDVCAQDVASCVITSSIPAAQRLLPCRISLLFRSSVEPADHHRVWRDERLPVSRTVRVFADPRAQDLITPDAPIPLMLNQARAMSGAHEQRIRGRIYIFVTRDEMSLTYRFDARGRTIEVRLEQVADSNYYLWSYSYQCRATAAAPIWVN